MTIVVVDIVIIVASLQGLVFFGGLAHRMHRTGAPWQVAAHSLRWAALMLTCAARALAEVLP